MYSSHLWVTHAFVPNELMPQYDIERSRKSIHSAVSVERASCKLDNFFSYSAFWSVGLQRGLASAPQGSNETAIARPSSSAVQWWPHYRGDSGKDCTPTGCVYQEGGKSAHPSGCQASSGQPTGTFEQILWKPADASTSSRFITANQRYAKPRYCAKLYACTNMPGTHAYTCTHIHKYTLTSTHTARTCTHTYAVSFFYATDTFAANCTGGHRFKRSKFLNWACKAGNALYTSHGHCL